MTIKKAYENHFSMGSALSYECFKEEGCPTLALISREFDSISPENELKWGAINPKPGTYNYGPADRFVEFCAEKDMYLFGHVLFWHYQTPKWVFADGEGRPASRELLLKRMRDHVRQLAGRYGTRIHGWDVVNEAIMESGKLRDSEWNKIIGDDFIEQAFRIASEELPRSVELVYNDYSMAGKAKRDAVVEMIGELKKKGIRIDGVGMQGHWSLNDPSVEEIEKSIVAFAKAGVDVHITELDIDALPRHPQMWSGNADVKLNLQNDTKLDPYKDGLPDEMQKKLAERYAEVFKVFVKHRDKIKRVTFWGAADQYSWLNDWPIKGRTNYPLLFDRERKPKPAFHAVMAVAGSSERKPEDRGQ